MGLFELRKINKRATPIYEKSCKTVKKSIFINLYEIKAVKGPSTNTNINAKLNFWAILFIEELIVYQPKKLFCFNNILKTPCERNNKSKYLKRMFS